jgi:twitching motility protein PilT
MTIEEILQITIDKNASDLHLIVNHYPVIRVNNDLYELRNFSLLSSDESQKLIISFLTPEQKENFFANKELDLSYEFNGSRFRVNIYYSKSNIAAAFRLIPNNIKTIEELKLPPVLHNLAKYKQGLILITGPTGEGKSTTLASMINEINLSESKHIVTIEDPVEFVYPEGKSIISQREIHQDTHSFNNALRSVLREDPDIVLIGEMRDYETTQAALTIAETGHLVLSTLHTRSTPETIDRIVDIFPSRQQNQIRNQFSSVLISVICQRLIPDIQNTGRLPATEILLNNSAVTSVIREGKNFLLENVLATSEDSGMIMFEKYLLNLYDQGLISKETAITYAIRPDNIKKLLK